MDHSYLIDDTAKLVQDKNRWDIRLPRLIDRGSGVSK
jgi:hypothetical protein